MLFSLKPFKHPVEKVQEVLEYFFEQLKNPANQIFSNALFPDWFDNAYLKGKFRTNMEAFFNDCKAKLTEDELGKLCAIFEQITDVKKVCDDVEVKSVVIQDLSKKVREIVTREVTKGENLFEWLYRYIISSKNSPILKQLGTDLSDHYTTFCTNNAPVCAFCGSEYYSLKESEGRADYDHFLSISDYPFLAINFKNLFPMGDHCNKRVKSNENILFSDFQSRDRRPIFYPYDENIGYSLIDFSIQCLASPSSANNFSGKWRVSLTPKDQIEQSKIAKISTWNAVFLIEDRYSEFIERASSGWINEIIFDDLKEKIVNLSKDELSLKIVEYLANRFDLVKLTDYRISNRVNLIPEHLFFKYLLEDNSIVLNLILIQQKNESSVDLTWLNSA